MFGDSGIRLASIIIGILFIIGIIVVANRFGGQIRQRLQSTKVASSTITPSPTGQPEPESDTFGQVVDQSKGGQTSSVYTNYNVKKNPDTGAEVIVIPVLVSLLGFGLKLRKSA